MNGTALAADQREAAIVRTSVVGIAANVALAAMKAAIGLASNSIAIVLDAVNNLSDALSSIITIAGTKLAHKQPDKKHPLGYGRIEYLTATIIAIIVLYAGITSLIESVEKIVSPEVADYSALTLPMTKARGFLLHRGSPSNRRLGGSYALSTSVRGPRPRFPQALRYRLLCLEAALLPARC